MLRIINDQLQWGERDMVAMTAIIGAEQAVTRRAPVLPSLARAAMKRGVVLSTRCQVMLERAQAARDTAKQLKKLVDTPAIIWKAEHAAFAHQRADFHFLRTMQKKHGYTGYMNVSDTGVGKTLVYLLWAYLHCGRADRNARHLIITKNDAKDQWHDAIRFFLGKRPRITVVDGTVAEQVEQAKTKRGFVIGHWESLSNASTGYIRRPWSSVGLDEAHKIGNPDALRSLAAAKLKADNRMAMTAHPFSNDPGELFAILRFLYPKLYRSYWRFFGMHVRATPKAFGGFEIEGARRPKLLQWEIAPFTIRHHKRDVFKSLPAISRVRRTVSLTTRGKREYERLRKQMFAELDAIGGDTKTIPIINDLARLTRVRQYLIDPGIIGAREPSVKYVEMLEVIDEVVQPIVIFTEYKRAALRLADYLRKKKPKLRIGHINGDVKRKTRTHVRKQFLAGDLNAVICVSAAADEALNLGKYGYVAHLDLPWTPRRLEQCEGRVDRPEENTGKLVPTTAYRVIVKDSYEERLEKKLEKKHGMFTAVFTVRDIKELFA
jgi:superfamily II DNA or RNA helicase